MADQAQHTDFGSKIGGARKDIWVERGLSSGDLTDMNDREAETYVKKDNIWKKPDYQAMIDSGTPSDVAYYIKTVRDSLNPAPAYSHSDNTPEKRLARQKQYIDTVRQMQEAMGQVKTKADVMSAFDKYMIDLYGWFERMEPGPSRSYYAVSTEKGRGNTAITSKLAAAVMIRSERDLRLLHHIPIDTCNAAPYTNKAHLTA